jgi:addiction module HigA family antidote
MAKKQTLLIPGEELKKLLDDYSIPISDFARDIGLSVSAIRQIISSKGRISLHIAKRLAKYFDTTTVEYWVDMQNAYDITRLDNDPEFVEVLKNIPKAKKVSGTAAGKEKRGSGKAAGKGTAKSAGRPTKKSAEPQAALNKPGRKPRKSKASNDD